MAPFRKKPSQSRTDVLETPQYGWIWKPLVALVVVYLLVCIVLGIWWSRTPSPVAPLQAIENQRGFPRSVASEGETPELATQPGEALLATNLVMLHTLLDKSGGYLRNDVMPPGLWLDNMPSWEKGVTRQVQDAVAAINGTLSVAAAPLGDAEDVLSNDLDSWRWPQSERFLAAGRNNLGEAFHMLENASGPGAPNQQAAAEGQQAPEILQGGDLADWLETVQQRLDAQTQALASNVGQSDQMTVDGSEGESNSWFRIDNVFFEARGTSWALLQLMQAARIDYADAIEQAGVDGRFEQLIAELKASQARVWSPVILNGSGFGFFANHSLMMANYTARSSQLVAQIREQL